MLREYHECNRSRRLTTIRFPGLGDHNIRRAIQELSTFEIHRQLGGPQILLGTTLLKGRMLSKPLMRLNHGRRAVVASGGACLQDNIGDFDKNGSPLLPSLAIVIESKDHSALHSLGSDITLQEDKSAKHARDLSLVPAQCSLCSLHSYSGKILSDPAPFRSQNRGVSPQKAVDRA
jgi:hypothetical protein